MAYRLGSSSLLSPTIVVVFNGDMRMRFGCELFLIKCIQYLGQPFTFRLKLWKEHYPILTGIEGKIKISKFQIFELLNFKNNYSKVTRVHVWVSP